MIRFLFDEDEVITRLMALEKDFDLVLSEQQAALLLRQSAVQIEQSPGAGTKRPVNKMRKAEFPRELRQNDRY